MSACMSDTRGSVVLSSTCDVLEMSVVRGVGGVCDICMCLARGVVDVEGVSGWENWVWLYQSCGDRGSVGRVSVFRLQGSGWCRWEWVGGLDHGRERWGGVMSV